MSQTELHQTENNKYRTVYIVSTGTPSITSTNTQIVKIYKRSSSKNNSDQLPSHKCIDTTLLSPICTRSRSFQLLFHIPLTMQTLLAIQTFSRSRKFYVQWLARFSIITQRNFLSVAHAKLIQYLRMVRFLSQSFPRRHRFRPMAPSPQPA